MFLPPPGNNDDNRVSDKPLPPLNSPAGSTDNTPALDGPQGDDRFYHVLDCLDKGSTRAEVRKQLIAFGHPADDAEQIVEDVAAWRRQNPGVGRYPPAPTIASPGSGSANSNMLIGGGICLLGIVITVGSCLASSGEGGGRFVLAWGAIIFGAIQFFRGLSQSGQE